MQVHEFDRYIHVGKYTRVCRICVGLAWACLFFNMADSEWIWEEDGCIEIKTQPVSLTYCSTLNCIVVSSKDRYVDIVDVNSGEVVRRNLLLGG